MASQRIKATTTIGRALTKVKGIKCRFSHIVGHLPKRFRLVCRTLGKKFLMTFRRARRFGHFLAVLTVVFRRFGRANRLCDWSNQTSVVVPYAVAGHASTRVPCSYHGADVEGPEAVIHGRFPLVAGFVPAHRAVSIRSDPGVAGGVR